MRQAAPSAVFRMRRIRGGIRLEVEGDRFDIFAHRVLLQRLGPDGRQRIAIVDALGRMLDMSFAGQSPASAKIAPKASQQEKLVDELRNAMNEPSAEAASDISSQDDAWEEEPGGP